MQNKLVKPDPGIFYGIRLWWATTKRLYSLDLLMLAVWLIVSPLTICIAFFGDLGNLGHDIRG